MPRPRPDSGPLKKISMDADPRDVAKLDRQARRAGTSRQALLRQIIREWLAGVEWD